MRWCLTEALSEWSCHQPLEVIMQVAANRAEAPVAIRTNLGAIFVSLELSRSKWLVTSISPGAGEKMSKFNIRAGDIPALLARLGSCMGAKRNGEIGPE